MTPDSISSLLKNRRNSQGANADPHRSLMQLVSEGFSISRQQMTALRNASVDVLLSSAFSDSWTDATTKGKGNEFITQFQQSIYTLSRQHAHQAFSPFRMAEENRAFFGSGALGNKINKALESSKIPSGIYSSNINP